MIDSRHEYPSTGILKLWEQEPETIEHLFFDVLLTETHGDVPQTEQNMSTFLTGYEELLRKYYPASTAYGLSPHTASVFMTLDNPAENYIFRIRCAERMAKYIGFEDPLGSAQKPNLPNYYRLCDTIVSAMKEHDSLIEKHYSFLTDDMYRDPGLHLMVFDLMHCSGYRGYYTGLIPTTIGKSSKRTAYKGPSAEEIARKEQERLEQILALEQKIDDLEISMEDFEEISLLGVEVTFPQYGTGKVIEQDIYQITVQFPEIQKDFILDKAYPLRPRFENDEEIVEAFTVYRQTEKEIKELKKKLDMLQE